MGPHAHGHVSGSIGGSVTGTKLERKARTGRWLVGTVLYVVAAFGVLFSLLVISAIDDNYRRNAASGDFAGAGSVGGRHWKGGGRSCCACWSCCAHWRAPPLDPCLDARDHRSRPSRVRRGLA